MLQKHRLYLSILIIMGYSLFSSWSTWHLDMKYMVLRYYLDMASILWHCIMLHCIALAYGVMSWTYGSDRTGTASFIGHNDAASYLGYEGSSSYASMCIHHWFGIEMQLHTLGMKIKVHVHLYAFCTVLRVGCDEVYGDTMNSYVSHCAMDYRTLDILYVGCMDTWILV